MVEKCSYEVSVDGKFMRALASGLMKRWDYVDNGYKEEYNVKSESELSTSEFMAFAKKYINIELEGLSAFADQEFDNNELQKCAIEYIGLLNDGLKAIDYYSINNEKYNALWSDIYNKRVLLIRTFVNEYNLDIDEEYQAKVEEFLANASVIEEENKLRADVKEMLESIAYETTDDGLGHFTYKFTIENISDVTFEYFSLEIQILDEEGNVIDSGYSESISDFESGQKATVDAYLLSKGDSIKYIASYSVKE